MTENTETRAVKATKTFLAADGTSAKHASPDAVAVVFAFADGNQLVVEPAAFNPTISRCLLLHGISQKIGDSYASAKDAAEAFETASALYEALAGEDGVWLQRGESAGPRASLLAEAMVRVVPDKYPTLEAAVERLSTLTKEERAARAKIPAVAAAIETIKAERATARAAKLAADAGTPDLTDL